MDNYNRTARKKYSLKVHLIFVTKYRKKIFTSQELNMNLKNIIYDIAKKYHYKIIQMKTDIDHIHILLEYKPKDSISNIVKILKQQSTYYLWLKYNDYLKQYFWKKKIIWSEGYFASSIGQVSQKNNRSIYQKPRLKKRNRPYIHTLKSVWFYGQFYKKVSNEKSYLVRVEKPLKYTAKFKKKL